MYVAPLHATADISRYTYPYCTYNQPAMMELIAKANLSPLHWMDKEQ